MHCAVPFFCARSGTEGEAAWRCGEGVVRSAGKASHSLRACVGAAWGSGSVRGGRVAVGERARIFGGECIAQPAGVRRGCVGERKCSGRACCCVGARGGLRRGGESARAGRVAVRGRVKAFGGEWVVRSAGVRRGCVGERKCSERACRCAGASEGLRRGRCCGAAGNASRSLRACVGVAWGSGSAREGRVAVRGRAKAFGGEWVVRSAGLTHIRRSSTRARVLLYIRPPCSRREIAAMGRKGVPCEYPSPAE